MKLSFYVYAFTGYSILKFAILSIYLFTHSPFIKIHGVLPGDSEILDKRKLRVNTKGENLKITTFPIEIPN